ncbi:DUF1553 domain-containing protein [Gimesia aquarii]|uniref:Planctomycete cytochrome C n=1 Tax=Gimesia aquarii TaxID=2527964 RepID=A0A517X109_9PLAN|nr:DUF1553 domain-containing protein [Gimesia aquarii]QDU11196.1 Planctomycete cytochrome C [Gimesia aquarii]
MFDTVHKSRLLSLSCISFLIIAGFSFSAKLSWAEPDKKQQTKRIKFNRDIRPILSDKCLHCHGPDASTREAELRLDDQRDVLKPRDDYHIIDLKQPQQSELLKRILSSDSADKMPPEESGKELSKQEIELIQRWIEQGAPYQKHWSFIAPSRPELPTVKNQGWPRKSMDHFILARLEQEKLSPNPRASKTTLCRRLFLDLTGLPPTLKELDTFLKDDSPNATEKLVDRLLKSSHYGEHMARYWLDAARYADTSGYFTDEEWYMWHWRDWVINAFNQNMPFDQFTIEQLAGDLLPKPSLSQMIATGFNRNHMTTRETGVIDEEYRVEYVVDRLDATSTVWMGLTMGCARCHDHKFDPISQKEFYQFFAFFNNSPERGNTGTAGNAMPLIQVPDPELQKRIEQHKKQIAVLEKQHQQRKKELNQQQAKWEQTILAKLTPPSADGLLHHFPLDELKQKKENSDTSIKSVGKPKSVAGVKGKAVQFDGGSLLEIDASLTIEHDTPFSVAAWIKPSSGGPICILSKNDDRNHLRGFDIMIRKGKLGVHFINKWNSNAIQVVTTNSISTGRWQHLLVTYDGSSKANGVRIYLNGEVQETKAPFDRLTGSIATSEPLRIGRRSTSAFYKGFVDDLRIYDRTLTAAEANQLATYQFLDSTVTLPAKKRTARQKEDIHAFFLKTAASDESRKAEQQLNTMRRKLTSLQKNMPTTMVMQENKKKRDTFILVRGVYNAHGEKVTANVPAALPEFKSSLPSNRLGLAKWLTSPQHPLTARVFVNRVWQQLFSTGLVKTVEDFGSQGEWPSHPELLDWLAVDFQENGWDVKRLVKQIVLSATYQQSSHVTDALYERDPENRLLARGPRFRLDAETVRDNALKISGLLSTKQGGPSVKPYQPAGLWEAVSYDGELKYKQDKGDALYRRSMYTYWKRQSPPPALMAFDAPTRETCTVRRPRTNTPLQALVLLNDPTYVEAARALAEKTLKQHDSQTARVQFAFRSATSRLPSQQEQLILTTILDKQRQVFEKNQPAALKLIGVGEAPFDKTVSPTELAAWTILTSTIFNMDETVTKN